eukprot:Colp12_sorted_trinity150504_noHs@18685
MENTALRELRKYIELLHSSTTTKVSTLDNDGFERALRWADYFEKALKTLPEEGETTCLLKKSIKEFSEPFHLVVGIDDLRCARKHLLRILLRNSALPQAIFPLVLEQLEVEDAVESICELAMRQTVGHSVVTISKELSNLLNEYKHIVFEDSAEFRQHYDCTIMEEAVANLVHAEWLKNKTASEVRDATVGMCATLKGLEITCLVLVSIPHEGNDCTHTHQGPVSTNHLCALARPAVLESPLLMQAPPKLLACLSARCLPFFAGYVDQLCASIISPKFEHGQDKNALDILVDCHERFTAILNEGGAAAEALRTILVSKRRDLADHPQYVTLIDSLFGSA